MCSGSNNRQIVHMKDCEVQSGRIVRYDAWPMTYDCHYFRYLPWQSLYENTFENRPAFGHESFAHLNNVADDDFDITWRKSLEHIQFLDLIGWNISLKSIFINCHNLRVLEINFQEVNLNYQEAYLMHQWCLLGASFLHPWCILDTSLMHHWLVLDTFLTHPWCILDASFMRPWCILDASLTHPWVILDASLMYS